MKSLVFALFASLAYCQTPLTTPVIVYPKADDSESGEIRLMEKRANGTNYVGFRADYDVTANILFKIPKVDGSPGKCWGYGNPGVISWVDCAGNLPVVDTTSIVKGSVDSTKQIRFEVDDLTPNTTRVLTPQDADYVLAGTNVSQTFTGTTTFAEPNWGTVYIKSTGVSPFQLTDIGALVFGDTNTQKVWSLNYHPGLGYVSLDYIPGGFMLWRSGSNLEFVSGRTFRPASNGVYDLGMSSYNWRDIYSSGTIYGNTATFTGKVSLSGSAAQLYANYNGNVIYIDSTNTSPKAIWVVGGGVMANRGIFNETYVANVYSGAPDVGSPLILDTSRNLLNINNITYSGTLTGYKSSFSGRMTLTSGGNLYSNVDGTIILIDTANSTINAIHIPNGGITSYTGYFARGVISYGLYVGTLPYVTQILDSSGNMFNLASFTVGSGNFYNRTFAGTPNCTGVTDGWTGVDTTNNRLYVCIGGSARYATLN
jgi:hypothetical protein